MDNLLNKDKVIKFMQGCKTFEEFEKRCKDLSPDDKLYAQCWWLCRQFKYNRKIEKINKLKILAENYEFDLDKIVNFANGNLKNNELDRHLANIIKLNKRLNDDKEQKELLNFIEGYINLIPIDNPTVYEGKKDINKCTKAYQYNYRKYHLDELPKLKNAFGHFLTTKKTDLKTNQNVIIISKSIVDKGLFNSTMQTKLHNEFGSDYEITKNTPTDYRKELLDKLDCEGIVKEGSEVFYKDVLIGCVTEQNDLSAITKEEKLLKAIFGEKFKKDVSILCPLQYGVVSKVLKGKKKIKAYIDITLDKTFKLGIGDTLGDIDGNKGQIIDIVTQEEMINQFGGNFDLVANFDIDNYIIRFKPNVEDSLKYSCGEIFALTYRNVLSCNDVLRPLKIDKNILNKFYRHNLIDALTEVICYSKQPAIKDSANVIIAQNGFLEMSKDDIIVFDIIRNYFFAIGVKIDVFRDENGNYNLTFKQMSDQEKLELSNGEISQPGTYNYRTKIPEKNGIFSEKVFGKNVTSYLRTKKDNKDLQKINCNFGHISLIKNFTSINGVRTNIIPVLPPQLRPLLQKNKPFTFNGITYLGGINEAYESLIIINNRIKKLKEAKVFKEIINSETKSLNERFVSYENYMLEIIIDYIKEAINENTISHSFKAVCCINNKISDNKCCVPEKVLVNLFKYQIAHILMNSQNMSVKEAFWLIKNMDNQVLKLLAQVIQNQKLVLFSTSKNGEILNLDIEPSKDDAIILNENNFTKLNIYDKFVCGFLPITENCKEMINKNLSQKTKDIDSIFDNETSTDLLKEIAKNEHDCKGIILDAIASNKAIKINSAVGNFIINTIFR